MHERSSSRRARWTGTRFWIDSGAIRASAVLAAAACTLLLSFATAQDPPARPGAAEIPADLLASPPFDRVTLLDGSVLLVEPVAPRPLPDPKQKKAEEKKKAEAEPGKKKSNLIIGKMPESIKRDDREGLVTLHTLPPDSQSFLVKQENIRSIDYFEDLLLADGLRLAQRASFERAFEHVLAAQSRSPSWPGLGERADRILLLEGKNAFDGRQIEKSIRILTELHDRRPADGEVTKLLGEACAERIGRAFDAGLFTLGRREITRLETVVPGHPEIERARVRFTTRAGELADRASKLQGPDRTEMLAEALRVWPNDPELIARFESAFASGPVLKVGVPDLPSRLGPWIRTQSDRRLSRLLYLPFLADISEEADRGERPGQALASLTTAELGRRVTLRVREGLTWTDSSRPVASVDLARTLTDHSLPSAPSFAARWSDLVESVRIVDASQVELVLSRSPVSLDAWLLGPVAPAHSGRDGRVWTPQGPRLSGTGPFEPAASDASALALDRREPSGEGVPAIARLREVAFADPGESVGALLRGDVNMLSSVPPARVAELSATAGVKLGTYAAPRMHWLALDGRKPALQNRSLRRALSAAIDRRTLLEDHVFGRPPDANEVPTDGPFPVESYANAPDVPPLEFDLLLARMLVAAARAELGGDPIELKLEYPTTPIAVAAIPPIVAVYQQIGLKINAVPRPPADLEDELRSGRPFELAFRSAPVLEPVLEAGPLLCPGYDAPVSSNGLGALVSPRILQLLLELELAQDWPTAREIVLELDRESRDELPIIPIWQSPERYAWRTEVNGPAETANDLYDGLPSWTVAPFFARDPE